MNNRKGLTLVEVILSIAILGIISVAFLTSISSHFTFLNKTKSITQEAFLAQREMEKEIDVIKDKIRKNELSLKEKTIFNSLGGVKVKYYEVEKTYNNKAYYTLVSDVKPEILEPIELESIEIKLKQGTTEVSYGYGTGGFNVVGSFKNDNKYKWDHLLNLVEWYVSTEDYNMPLPKAPDFDLNDDILYYSYYYPLFPRDYILVSNETIYNFGTHERAFPKLDSYAGRHIIFTVTPGAKSGKIGKQSVSKPVFVSGLPITDNLAIHFDAGFIDPSDENEVKEAGGINKVEKWLDISSIYGNNQPSQAAITPSSYEKPELLKTEMGVGFIGQYVKFSQNQYLKIENQNTENKTIYVFSVVRNRSINEESLFLDNGDKQLTIPTEVETIDNNWTIVKESFESNNNTFILGGPNVDIAEIIVYDGQLTPEKIQKVENYLNSKYKSPTISGDIVKLKDMEKEIKIGQNFILPSSVLAEMSRGSEKYVAVTWSGNFDINTVGTYKLIGTSLTDPTKKMTYILTVVDN